MKINAKRENTTPIHTHAHTTQQAVQWNVLNIYENFNIKLFCCGQRREEVSWGAWHGQLRLIMRQQCVSEIIRTHVEEMQMEIAMSNWQMTMENPAIDFDALTSDSRTVLCNSHCTAAKQTDKHTEAHTQRETHTCLLS